MKFSEATSEREFALYPRRPQWKWEAKFSEKFDFHSVWKFKIEKSLSDSIINLFLAFNQKKKGKNVGAGRKGGGKKVSDAGKFIYG